MRACCRRLFAAILFLPGTLLAADTAYRIEQILELKNEPAGVVFEIVTGREDALRWAIPQIKKDIHRLRDRFPKLPVVVVSHGREQFSLQKSKGDRVAKTEVQSLTGSGVTVHVCATYAARKDVSEEDFPEYINVAASGPAQINDYVALGYLRVKLTHPQKN